VKRNLNPVRWGLLLPVLAAALLIPSARTYAQHKANGAMKQVVTDGQIRDYNQGIKIWDTARGKDARERSALLEKAARSFQAAIKPNKPFAEATLALGLVRYSQNNLSGAESLFAEAARLSKGPVRIEALTHLGMVALRQGRWAAADEAFESAMREDARNYNTWEKDEKKRVPLIRTMTGRGEHAKRVARVGSLLASYHAALATPPATREPALRALLDEIRDRFPANELPFYQFELDDVKAALVHFPDGTANFSGNLLDGRPGGSAKVTLEDAILSIQTWALAELAQQPPRPLAQLKDQDQRNAVGGLQRRALAFERAGRLGDALSVWEQIAGYPQSALMARQHRIWILLQQNNLSAARTVIRGAGAANDPLLYDQQLALASAVVKGAPASGQARNDALRAASDEFRLLVDGMPGVAARPSETQRSLAEWNLAAIAVNTQPNVGPAEWEQRLNRFPPLPGREAIILYIAVQWSQAALEAGQPADVERAVGAAQRIAAGTYAPGLQATPRGADMLILLRRFLAKRIFERNEVGRYANFLRTTDYGGEYRGWEAAKALRARNERVKQNPSAVGDDQGAFEAILRLLTDARTMTGGNADLERRLDADIAEVRAYLQAIQGKPQTASGDWNRAAGLTNNAKTAADWQRAADAWRATLMRLPNNASAQRSTAARHVVMAYVMQADALYRSGDLPSARAALDQAANALGNGPGGVGMLLTPEDRAPIQTKVDANLTGMMPTSEIRGTTIPFTPFTGKAVPPDQNRCVISRYPSPITPNVEQWVENLRNRPSSVRRLVDWFNNGPLAKKYPDAKRDFSADPNSPNYLVDFLDKNLSRQVGVLPVGSMQWCDHQGKGPWHGQLTKKVAAAYFLKNGTPIIRVACDNPLNPIRVLVTPSRWVFSEERATPIVPAVAPDIDYREPDAPFSFPVPQVYRAYTLPQPGGVPERLIGPAPAVFVAPRPLIPLPLDVCKTVGDC
jgi:hypothetical protein